jgi:hypothetical protein
MITNSGTTVIPNHDSSEIQNDDRQNSYKIRNEINLNLKSHQYVSRNSVLFSVQHDTNNPNQPRTDSDGIFNAIE